MRGRDAIRRVGGVAPSWRECRPGAGIEPDMGGLAISYSPPSRLGPGVKRGEFIPLKEEGEDDFRLKVSKMHPGAAVPPSKPNQAMGLRRLIVLRGEPFRPVLTRVWEYLRHSVREGRGDKGHGPLRDTEALRGKGLGGLAHHDERDRMEPLKFL